MADLGSEIGSVAGGVEQAGDLVADDLLQRGQARQDGRDAAGPILKLLQGHPSPGREDVGQDDQPQVAGRDVTGHVGLLDPARKVKAVRQAGGLGPGFEVGNSRPVAHHPKDGAGMLLQDGWCGLDKELRAVLRVDHAMEDEDVVGIRCVLGSQICCLLLVKDLGVHAVVNDVQPIRFGAIIANQDLAHRLADGDDPVRPAHACALHPAATRGGQL